MTPSKQPELLKSHCEHYEQCMQMIQAVLDGSATAEELEHFKQSMQTCKPCIDGYQLEESIKEALHKRLERKTCPQATVHNIMSKIGYSMLVTGLVMFILD